MSIDSLQSTYYQDLQVTLEDALRNGRIGSALTIMYVVIDMFGNLCRPAGKEYNNSDDFAHWVDKYVDVIDANLTSGDLWAARCAVLHTMGATSRDTDRKCSKVVIYETNSDRVYRMPRDRVQRTGMIRVDVERIWASVKAGVGRCIVEHESDEQFVKRCRDVLIYISKGDPRCSTLKR